MRRTTPIPQKLRLCLPRTGRTALVGYEIMRKPQHERQKDRMAIARRMLVTREKMLLQTQEHSLEAVTSSRRSSAIDDLR